MNLKKIFAWLVCIMLGLCLFGCGPDTEPVSSDSESSDSGNLPEAVDHYVGLTDQKNHRIVVYDMDVEDWTSEAAVVWEYKGPLSHHAAGIKLRYSEFWGGYVVLTCGPTYAGIIDYATKQPLWSTTNVPQNPHSVEVLPDGNFLCAGSTGNTVRIYAASTKRATCNYSDVTLSSAHGLLWDPSYEVVWMLGGSRLEAYAVDGTSANPTLSRVQNMGGTLPGGAAHDLAPVYGDTNRIWCTGGDGVYQFDKEENAFTEKYVGRRSLLFTYVPGVGNFPDGSLVCVVPNNCLAEWNTDNVKMFIPNDAGTRIQSSVTRENKSDAYYKVRVWISDYQ